jgi:hypothetical protein
MHQGHRRDILPKLGGSDQERYLIKTVSESITLMLTLLFPAFKPIEILFNHEVGVFYVNQ